MKLPLQTALLAAVLTIAPCAVLFAQSNRDAAIGQFADELAAIQAAFPASQTELQMALASGAMDEIWQQVIERVRALQDAWRDNQYVEVTGFSVSLGWAPSVDVQFQFK